MQISLDLRLHLSFSIDFPIGLNLIPDAIIKLGLSYQLRLERIRVAFLFQLDLEIKVSLSDQSEMIRDLPQKLKAAFHWWFA